MQCRPVALHSSNSYFHFIFNFQNLKNMKKNIFKALGVFVAMGLIISSFAYTPKPVPAAKKSVITHECFPPGELPKCREDGVACTVNENCPD